MKTRSDSVLNSILWLGGLVFSVAAMFSYSDEAANSISVVSVINLVADPSDYIAKSVKVRGYYDFGSTSALYLNKTAYDIHDDASSIEVADPTPDGKMTMSCASRYVIVTGTVLTDNQGYEYIGNVSQVFDIKENDYCWISSDTE